MIVPRSRISPCTMTGTIQLHANATRMARTMRGVRLTSPFYQLSPHLRTIHRATPNLHQRRNYLVELRGEDEPPLAVEQALVCEILNHAPPRCDAAGLWVFNILPAVVDLVLQPQALVLGGNLAPECILGRELSGTGC